MNIKSTFLAAVLSIFCVSVSTAQIVSWNPTQTAITNTNLLGTCAATCVPLNIINPTLTTNNPKGGGNDQTMNGNGSIGLNYSASACGLNYVIAGVKTGKRYFPAAANQPVALNVTGLPVCKTILKAFLYVGGSGNGIAFNTTMTNPAASNSVFPMTMIGFHSDKCWGYTGTYNYRADVTALITGNGAYNISGIPTSITTPGNDMDGASLVIIYTDPTQAYTGNIVIGDGCLVGIGGAQQNNLVGWNACAASNFQNAFMIVSDLQNVGSIDCKMNSAANNVLYPNGSQQWWDNIVSGAIPAVTAGQNSATFGCNSSFGDCYNIVCEALYFRNGCLACAVTPLAITTATTSSCTIGSATAIVTGGTGPYSYTWTPSAASTSFITNVAPGTYTVKAADATGCATIQAIVTIPAGSATVGATSATVCPGVGAVLTATGALTYTWNPGNIIGSSASFTPLATQVYTVKGTAAGGCTAQATGTITVNPAPVPLPGSNSPVCTGGQINLTVNAFTSYTWTGPNSFNSNLQNPSIPNASTLSAGNYTVKVTSALGCTAQAVVNVVVNPTPTITVGNPGPYCTGSTINLTVTAASSYTWTGPLAFNSNLQNPTIANSTTNMAGPYVVTVTAAGGCKSTGTVNVVVNAKPTPTATSNSPVCIGQQINLFTNPAASSYTWNGPSFTSNAQNPSISSASLANGGNYTVTVTNAAGCTNTSVVTVVINPLPVIAVNNPTTCVGSTFTLTATGGTAYAWTGPNSYNTPVQNPGFANAQTTHSGNYTVVVTSAQGCTNSAVANVSVIANPTISVIGTNTMCSQNFNASPNTVVLTAGGGNSYVWNLPGGFSATPNLSSNPITLTPPVTSTSLVATMSVVGTVGSCTAQAVYQVTVYPNPTIAVTSASMCAGTQVTLTASNASTYTWSPATNLNTTTGPVVIANPANTTVYSVIGTSVGCKSQTQTGTVTVVANPTVTINPNPALICLNSSINLTASGATTYSWSPNIALTTTLGPNTTASPTVTTTYSIIGSQATCTNLATIQVSVIGLPTVSVIGNNTLCSQNFNGSPATTTLTAGGASTYQWSLPAGFSASPNLSSNPIILTPPVTTTSLVATMSVIGTAGSCTSSAVYQVTVWPNPTIAVTSASMCAGTQVTLTASGASTFTWSPTTNLNTSTGPVVIANPANTTVYSVIGSSIGCNSQTQNGTVTVVANPTVAINPNPALICLNSSINLTASGATTYTWSPNIALTTTLGPNTTASPTVTTTYSIIGSQATCTNLATIQVSVIGLPTVSVIGNNTLCSQNFNGSPATTTLTASGAGTYVWTLPAGFSGSPSLNSNPIVITPPVTSSPIVATMTVLGTAGTCTNQAVYTITVIPNPTIATTSGSMCAGTQVTLTASNASTYTWSPAATLNTANGPVVVASPAVTTVYSVIGSSVGCNSQTQNATATVVNNPTVTIAPNPALICLNSSINLTASGANNYTWTPNIALTTTLGPNTTANPTVTTTYSIVGEAATCTNLATIQVSVIGLPTVSIAGTNTLCSQNFNGSPATTTLTASGAGSYVWTLPAGFSGSPSLNSNPLVITPPVTSAPVVATMTVLGTAGTCTNLAYFTLTVIPNPTIATTSGSMCAGTSVALTASNAQTYTWTPSATLNTANGPNVTASPAVTTVYSIIGSSVGCNSQTGNATAIVVNNPTVTIAPNPAVICLNQSINLTASGANNYTWSPNTALTSTNTPNTTANPTVTTVYQVIGEAATCTNVANITVSVLPLPTVNVVPSSPTLCMNNFNGSPNSVTFNATGAVSYTWGPVVGVASTNTLNGPAIVATSDGFSSLITGTIVGSSGTCTNSTTFSVNAIPNPVIATTSGSMCAGTSVMLTAANAQTYTWTPSATLNTANGPVVTASPSVTTVYSIIGSSVGCQGQTQNATAIVVNNPTVSIAPLTPTICFGTSINLTASGANNYTWSPNVAISATTGANVSVNPTVTTTYQLIGEAATCTHTAFQTVTVVPLPVINIALSSQTMCMNNFNGSVNQITVTASGATTYNWTGFSGITPNTTSGSPIVVTAIPNSPMGTGTVVGSAATCTNVATFSVIAAPNPIITVPTASVCQFHSVSLTASGAQTYVWSPANTLNSSTGATVIASPTVTTVYSVIGSSINCQSPTQQTTVDVVANPVIVIAPVNPTICAGSPIGLSAFGANNYTWTPNMNINTTTGANVIVNPTTTTVYQVLGEAATCTSTAIRQVSVIPLPDLQAVCNPSTICAGDKTTINANGATSYTWSPTYGLSSGSSNFVTANPTITMVYGIIGSNGVCQTSISITVSVTPRPVLQLTVDKPKICKGNSASIFASGAISYSWTPPAAGNITNTTMATFTPSTTSRYTVTGYNAGCPFTKEIEIEVVQTITATVSNSLELCEGSYTRLTAGGSNQYVWAPGAGLSNSLISQPYVSPTVSTTYTVYVSDGGNCPVPATVFVKVNPLPVVDAGPDMTINADEPMYLNAKGTGTLTWTFGEGILCHVCPNSQFMAKESGNYKIQAVNEYGCVATDEMNVEVTNDWSIYIPNIFTPNYDSNNDTFLVYGVGIYDIAVTIFDRWGEQIYHDDNQTKGWDGIYRGELGKNDVYVYLVNFTSLDGKKHTKSGHVTLMK